MVPRVKVPPNECERKTSPSAVAGPEQSATLIGSRGRHACPRLWKAVFCQGCWSCSGKGALLKVGTKNGIRNEHSDRSPLSTPRVTSPNAGVASNPEGCQPLAGGCREATTPGGDECVRNRTPAGCHHGDNLSQAAATSPSDRRMPLTRQCHQHGRHNATRCHPFRVEAN